MITVFGEGRGFRVVWLLEEMGLAYKLRPVDLLVGVEHDPEYLAINPPLFIPAIQDGDVTMVESVAIMEYLAGPLYGPTPLAPEPHDPAFPRVPTVPSPRRSQLAASILLRCRRPQSRARGRAAELGRPQGAGSTREPTGVGDPACFARSPHLAGRYVHRSRHFGDLRPGVGPKKWRRRPRRGRAGRL
jgi:hypothetical protein